MAFAIFWMVIGELVAIHQERIFGVNFYGNHSPFTKPTSNNDTSTVLWKAGKGGDKSFSFLASDIHFGSAFCFGERWFLSLLLSKPPVYLSKQFFAFNFLLRGPPNMANSL